MGSCHIGKNGFSFRIQLATVRMVPNSRPAERAAPSPARFDSEVFLFCEERGGHHPYFVHSMAVDKAVLRSNTCVVRQMDGQNKDAVHQ